MPVEERVEEEVPDVEFPVWDASAYQDFILGVVRPAPERV
jgi:hypothetical protein